MSGLRGKERGGEARAWAGCERAWSERDMGARRGGEGVDRVTAGLVRERGRCARRGGEGMGRACAEASITLKRNALPFLYAKKVIDFVTVLDSAEARKSLFHALVLPKQRSFSSSV